MSERSDSTDLRNMYLHPLNLSRLLCRTSIAGTLDGEFDAFQLPTCFRVFSVDKHCSAEDLAVWHGAGSRLNAGTNETAMYIPIRVTVDPNIDHPAFLHDCCLLLLLLQLLHFLQMPAGLS